jgi:uncharacterized DUF497 family protein
MPKIAEFSFDQEKSRKLKAERGIGFEEIITYIESDNLVDLIDHPNQHKYPGQLACIVNIEGYIWMVPCIRRDDEWHLITAFRSKKVNKSYEKKKK